MKKFVWVGRPAQGTDLCGWRYEREQCGAPAAWHMVIEVDVSAGNQCVFLCGEHEDRVPYIERHHVGPNCDMPMATWYTPGCTTG